MFIDDTIVIDFPIPKSLQWDINQLEDDYKRDDELDFALHLDGFEAMAKQAHINGNITANQLRKLFHRYGLFYDSWNVFDFCVRPEEV